METFIQEDHHDVHEGIDREISYQVDQKYSINTQQEKEKCKLVIMIARNTYAFERERSFH